MFHEHDTMEENVRGTKLTFEGVVDLTPGRISPKSIIDGVGIPESKQGTEIKEPVIEEEENGDDDDDTGGVD